MATLAEFLEKILPGLASGGVTAIGTAYSYLKDFKARITTLESTLNSLQHTLSDLEKRTGVACTNLAELEKRVGRSNPDTGTKSGILRLASDAKVQSDNLTSRVSEIERILQERPGSQESMWVDPHVKLMEDRIKRLEDRIERFQTLEQAQREQSARDRAAQELNDKVSKVQGSIDTLHSLFEKIVGVK